MYGVADALDGVLEVHQRKMNHNTRWLYKNSRSGVGKGRPGRPEGTQTQNAWANLPRCSVNFTGTNGNGELYGPNPMPEVGMVVPMKTLIHPR